MCKIYVGMTANEFSTTIINHPQHCTRTHKSLYKTIDPNHLNTKIKVSQNHRSYIKACKGEKLPFKNNRRT